MTKSSAAKQGPPTNVAEEPKSVRDGPGLVSERLDTRQKIYCNQANLPIDSSGVHVYL